MFKVSRVVIGENRSFLGGEDLLKERGIEVEVLQDNDCYALMQDFIREKPKVW